MARMPSNWCLCSTASHTCSIIQQIRWFQGIYMQLDDFNKFVNLQILLDDFSFFCN
jgi:hypothetical protein